jgi:hypothetical protein
VADGPARERRAAGGGSTPPGRCVRFTVSPRRRPPICFCAARRRPCWINRIHIPTRATAHCAPQQYSTHLRSRRLVCIGGRSPTGFRTGQPSGQCRRRCRGSPGSSSGRRRRCSMQCKLSSMRYYSVPPPPPPARRRRRCSCTPSHKERGERH